MNAPICVLMHQSNLMLYYSMLTMAGVLFGMGCADTNDSTLLKQEQLVDLVVDVQLAEAALKTHRPSDRDSMSAIYYGQIAEIHDLTPTEVLQQLEWLNENPKLLHEVFEEVLTELNRMDAADPSD